MNRRRTERRSGVEKRRNFDRTRLLAERRSYSVEADRRKG